MTLPPIWPRCPSTVISHHNLPNCPSLWNNEWTPSIRRPATSSSTPLSTSSTNTHFTAGWKGLEGRLTALSITISGSRSGTSRWHSTTTTPSRRSAFKYCRIWSPGWSPTMYYQVLMFYMRSSCSSSSSPLHYVKVAEDLKHLCFFSVKINISTTGGFRVGFFQPDTNHP